MTVTNPTGIPAKRFGILSRYPSRHTRLQLIQAFTNLGTDQIQIFLAFFFSLNLISSLWKSIGLLIPVGEVLKNLWPGGWPEAIKSTFTSKYQPHTSAHLSSASFHPPFCYVLGHLNTDVTGREFFSRTLYRNSNTSSSVPKTSKYLLWFFFYNSCRRAWVSTASYTSYLLSIFDPLLSLPTLVLSPMYTSSLCGLLILSLYTSICLVRVNFSKPSSHYVPRNFNSFWFKCPFMRI